MPHEKLEKDNYPGIQFWTWADWTELDDTADANKDLGYGMQFLEDEDRCVIRPTALEPNQCIKHKSFAN